MKKVFLEKLNMIMAIVAIVIMASCASSKKFDYASAYKFSYRNYNKAPKEEVAKEETNKADEQEVIVEENTADNISNTEKELYASEKIMVEEDVKAKLEKAEQKILDKIGVNREEAAQMKPEELVAKVRALDKKDKKELRKEIKSDLKSLRKAEMSNNKSVNNDTKDTLREMGLTGYTRTGAILGGVGIILLLLGAVFSDILVFFGVALVLAGVVFILVDLF